MRPEAVSPGPHVSPGAGCKASKPSKRFEAMPGAMCGSTCQLSVK